jgi:hypothetical protein
MNRNRSTPILSFLLYGFAVVTLFAAIWILFTSLNFRNDVVSSMKQILETLGPVAGMMADMLNTAVSILGMVFAGLVLTISGLLFTAARMLIYSNTLSNRIAQIETKLETIQKKLGES